MKMPSHADAFEVLVLQAADEGRGPVLFGQCAERARELARPFMVGTQMPDVYLEFPLLGEPFIDVTVLFRELAPGTRVDSPAVQGLQAMLDWYAQTRPEDPSVCCGFELDIKHEELPAAAVHFESRRNLGLVVPFCEAAGEPQRAALYLEQDARMPQGWPLSFFGMFKGRPGSPLRVCGYLNHAEKEACATDPERIATAFDQAGFAAYDQAMLAQVARVLRTAPGSVDFQFDVYPDGSLGDVFAIDVQFEIEQPQAVRASFESGPAGRVMALLEEWGLADKRWQLGAQSAFARAIPVECDDGSTGRFAFTLMPQWAKVRWTNKTLQPAKLYLLAHAGLMEA